MEKKERYLEKIKAIRKDQWFLIMLAGILGIVVFLPTKENSSLKMQETAQMETLSDMGEISELERKLENILAQMAGAGKVQVMITQTDNGEKIVEKDVPTQERTNQEEGGEGNLRTEKEVQREETTVYFQNDNTQMPYVVRELSPKIAGVLVLAQGGDDPVVEKNITDAVMALFGLDAHKIKVMKMN